MTKAHQGPVSHPHPGASFNSREGNMPSGKSLSYEELRHEMGRLTDEELRDVIKGLEILEAQPKVKRAFGWTCIFNCTLEAKAVLGLREMIESGAIKEGSV